MSSQSEKIELGLIYIIGTSSGGKTYLALQIAEQMQSEKIYLVNNTDTKTKMLKDRKRLKRHQLVKIPWENMLSVKHGAIVIDDCFKVTTKEEIVLTTLVSKEGRRLCLYPIFIIAQVSNI